MIYKIYGKLPLFSPLTHRWKNLCMNFFTRLSIYTNLKSKIYNSILVIVDQFTKIVYYKPIKIKIIVLGLVKVFLYIVVRHYLLPDSIISNKNSIFTFKFWSSSYYFLGIIKRFSIAFYPPINCNRLYSVRRTTRSS